jgi:outer membrane protein assembly factor BamE (lipoprotein component of BamABCDE complex)
MKSKCILVTLAIGLLATFSAAADTPAHTTRKGVNMDMVAKIKVGSSTGAQVEQLLGKPSRTTNYGDCNPIDYQEIWEYTGFDNKGVFMVHIEFDEDHIARIIAKVPQRGAITVLATSAKPEMKHQH